MSKKILGTGHYSKKVQIQASKLGASVRTSRGVKGRNLKMHRDNLLDWASSSDGVDTKARTVTDPRTIIPYNHCKNYGLIVRALMTKLPRTVKSMVGKISKDYSRILSWSGVKKPEIDGIVASSWVWGSVLHKIACTLEPNFRNSVENFCNNIGTIQRWASPDHGGITPYGKPLMDCEYCIDSRWGIHKGQPEIQCRIIIGRSIPRIGSKKDLKSAKKKVA